MGKDELSNRETWQDISGTKATNAEHSFFSVFCKAFEETNFTVIARPKELNTIYVDFPLSQQTLSEIYAHQTASKNME